MVINLATAALALGSGSLVGLMLGLVGGGGSILAVPLLVYAVGVPSAHAAIGTAAIAVALNAASGLAAHARLGTVKWRCAFVFSGAGIAGAAMGAQLGKTVNADKLLALFGVMMIAVGLSMLLPRGDARAPNVRLTRETAAQLLPRLMPIGAGVGLLSGFFGIGGGFLIVPGLMLATGMALPNAISTSLVAVTAFGLTTAASYAIAGFVDWPLALLVIAGGVIGSLAGTKANAKLAQHDRALATVFAIVVAGVGAYVTVRGFGPLMSMF